jgi:hypothetical protein
MVSSSYLTLNWKKRNFEGTYLHKLHSVDCHPHLVVTIFNSSHWQSSFVYDRGFSDPSILPSIIVNVWPLAKQPTSPPTAIHVKITNDRAYEPHFIQEDYMNICESHYHPVQLMFNLRKDMHGHFEFYPHPHTWMFVLLSTMKTFFLNYNYILSLLLYWSFIESHSLLVPFQHLISYITFIHLHLHATTPIG